MPSAGYWPTNTKGNTHQALSWNPQLTPPFILGGSFLPMIRVMVGSLSSNHSLVSTEQGRNFGFEEIYPNPFNPASGVVDLNVNLSEDAFVSIGIYDEVGKEVRTVLNGKLEKGRHTLQWDGKDALGNTVSQGIYFCSLVQGSLRSVMNIVVVH
jgi:hypothetical protein